MSPAVACPSGLRAMGSGGRRTSLGAILGNAPATAPRVQVTRPSEAAQRQEFELAVAFDDRTKQAEHPTLALILGSSHETAYPQLIPALSFGRFVADVAVETKRAPAELAQKPCHGLVCGRRSLKPNDIRRQSIRWPRIW